MRQRRFRRTPFQLLRHAYPAEIPTPGAA
jgi:hypothetical protein